MKPKLSEAEAEAEKRRRARQEEEEERRRARQRAMSLAQFCQNYSIGRTKAYEEIVSGRLRALKNGRRTIITEDDAEEWLRHLPPFETDDDP